MIVALFFGSFNPIHVGHLITAQTIVDQTDADQVWFVVSPQNPFKNKKSLLHEFDRMDMVQAAIHDNSKFGVTDIEFHMPKPSYTIDTLARLQDQYTEYQFRVVMGGDNLNHFHKWKNHEKVLAYFGLYVYPRLDMNPSSVFLKSPHVKLIDAPLLNISATFIRKAIEKNQSIKYLVPNEVATLIEARKYYQ